MALEIATQDVAPIAGTTAGEYSFTRDMNTIALDNRSTGQNMFIKFNFDAGDPASATVYDLRLIDGALYMGDVKKELGLGRVRNFSVWFPAGATVANINFVGG